MCVNSHKEPCWLRGNLHLHNKCYMKSGALFSHASSAIEVILIFYLDYCLVRIGNSSFILPIISVMCRQCRALANVQTACGLNLLVEDSQHCSAMQEAGLDLIIHEAWFGRFFSLLCWLHACCYEPWSLPTSGSVRKGESANKACGIFCLTD